jgi:hypothetical protein
MRVSDPRLGRRAGLRRGGAGQQGDTSGLLDLLASTMDPFQAQPFLEDIG